MIVRTSLGLLHTPPRMKRVRWRLGCSKSRDQIEILRLASVFTEDAINTILTFALAMRPDGNTIAFILILKNILHPIAGALSRPLFVEMSPKCMNYATLHTSGSWLAAGITILRPVFQRLMSCWLQ